MFWIFSKPSELILFALFGTEMIESRFFFVSHISPLLFRSYSSEQMQPPGRILCSFPKYSCKVIELIGSTMSEILEDTAMDGRKECIIK